MKQIIPFKKEVLFKTKVSEITAISLEHTLTLKNDDLISGEFHISGDYKMTEGSINREKFQFRLPFDIALDSRYELSSIIIDIDNFYYEIINNESLQVNIDVYIEGEKIEEVQVEEIVFNDANNIIDENVEEVISLSEMNKIVINNSNEDDNVAERGDTTFLNNEFKKDIENLSVQKAVFEAKDGNSLVGDFNLFDSMDSADTYVTYYVYMVKEEDTLDKILNKYQVSKEEVALYNNIDEIKPGAKLIIPSNCNE